MTPEPIPDEDEEIDPVDAVERAVRSVDRREFDDGHELKQLIKNENGVTLPDAGKFLLKALRSDSPPIRREGDTFVGLVGEEDGEGTAEDEAEDEESSGREADGDGGAGDGTAEGAAEDAPKGGAEDEEDRTEGETEYPPEAAKAEWLEEETQEQGERSTEEARDEGCDAGDNGNPLSEVPEGLRKSDVWAVRYTDGTVVKGLTAEEAVDETGAVDAEVGYGSVVTVDIVGCVGDGELDDRLPDAPFGGAYAERLADEDGEDGRGGWRVPVVGYDAPDWWSDVGGGDGEAAIEVSEGGFRGATGEPVAGHGSEEGAVAKRGGRDVDEWLADVLEATEGLPFGSGAPDEAPEVDGEALTDDRVREALRHIDPDLPYPEWRKLGAALTDVYDDTQEARRAFEDWSREGDMYDEDVGGFVRGVEAYGRWADVGAGYLVHRACLGGWVWEAEEDEEKSAAASDGEGEGDEDEGGRRDRDAEAVGRRRTAEFVERRSGYGYVEAGPRDGADVGEFDRVTNFPIETERRIESDGGRLLELRVEPEDEEPYCTTVEPDALGSVERFRSEVATGFTTWFDGDGTDLRRIRERVGASGVGVSGTRVVGLHGDEFVTPEGTLSGDGWETNPDTVFVLEGGGVEQRWALSEREGAEEGAAEVAELLPDIHGSGEFLTVLGWFYAAPLKPFVVERAEYFPSLWLTGDVEGAKHKVRLLNRAFGTDGEAFSIGSASWGGIEAFAGSRSVPVWYDGYGTSEVGRERLCTFHDYCLKSTRCAEARAPDGGVRGLSAPVVVTGDEADDRSLARRSIEVNLKKDGDEPRKSYARLAGRCYYDDGDLRNPEGADLGAHAEAYYTWVAGEDDAVFDDLWESSLRNAGDVMRSRGGDDAADIHDVRVTLFGLKLYQKFAEEVGAEPAISAERRAGENEVATAQSDD